LHAKKATEVEVILSRAVTGGNRRTIDLLIARGAAKHPPSAAAALTTAALNGSTAVVESLLAQGADPNLNPTFQGHALNERFGTSSVRLPRFLIEKGSDLNLPSPRGHGTPPMVFAGYNQSGDPSVAKALVARGGRCERR